MKIFIFDIETLQLYAAYKPKNPYYDHPNKNTVPKRFNK